MHELSFKYVAEFGREGNGGIGVLEFHLLHSTARFVQSWIIICLSLDVGQQCDAVRREF